MTKGLVPIAAPRTIAPGLYQGDEANPNISAAAVKANRVMAETLQRLSHNAYPEGQEPFGSTVVAKEILSR